MWNVPLIKWHKYSVIIVLWWSISLLVNDTSFFSQAMQLLLYDQSMWFAWLLIRLTFTTTSTDWPLWKEFNRISNIWLNVDVISLSACWRYCDTHTQNKQKLPFYILVSKLEGKKDSNICKMHLTVISTLWIILIWLLLCLFAATSHSEIQGAC